MSNQTWLIVALIGVVLVLLTVLIVAGYGPAIRRVVLSIWNSRIGSHVVLVLALIVAFEGAKTFAIRSANDKASKWLTSYNGVEATKAVGNIAASVTGLLATPTPTPSPSPTGSPAASPTPDATPTPAPVGAPTPTQPAASVAADAQRPSATASPTPSPTPTEAERERLKVQLRTIRDRVKHHGDVMADFYVYYYMAIVMVMTCGLTVALTLFFIAQHGWNNTNTYVRTVFVVAAAYAAFYGLFPPVFQQQKNIVDNKELFLKYKARESEVESYGVTLMNIKGEPKSPGEFITYVDAEMSRLGNIALGFDITKVTYQQAFELEPKPTPSPTTTPSPPGKGK